jgi:hypothetical protein
MTGNSSCRGCRRCTRFSFTRPSPMPRSLSPSPPRRAPLVEPPWPPLERSFDQVTATVFEPATDRDNLRDACFACLTALSGRSRRSPSSLQGHRKPTATFCLRCGRRPLLKGRSARMHDCLCHARPILAHWMGAARSRTAPAKAQERPRNVPRFVTAPLPHQHHLPGQKSGSSAVGMW